MAAFDLENFTHRLLAETFFYDQEYGIIGSLSLVDREAQREAFIVSFLPEDGAYLIEEATAWETDVPEDADEAVAYALAVDSTDHATFEIPEEAAAATLALAEANDLLPSFAFLFEDEAL